VKSRSPARTPRIASLALLLLAACPRKGEISTGMPSIPLPWSAVEVGGRVVACQGPEGDVLSGAECPAEERMLLVGVAEPVGGEVVLTAGRAHLVVVPDEDIPGAGNRWAEVEQDFGPRPTGLFVEEVRDPDALAARIDREFGLEGAVSLVQAFRVDLDGSGPVTLFTSDTDPEMSDMEGPLDLRVVVGAILPDGTLVELWSHDAALAEGEVDAMAAQHAGIAGLTDLGLDGRLEVVVWSEYYELEGYGVYAYADGAFDAVGGAGCGL
jgi:hypothetical protein